MHGLITKKLHLFYFNNLATVYWQKADQLIAYIGLTDGQYRISCTIELEWIQTGDLEN